jgi:hypothetical protein
VSLLFLCREQDLDKERRGYARALRLRGGLQCVPNDFAIDGQIKELFKRLPDKPTLIVHPDPRTPILPRGISDVDVPTACFQIDTFRSMNARIAVSMLFDYVLLFLPGFESQFKKAGHPRPITFPHAVEADAFAELPGERIFEVGFIGWLDPPIYETRRRLLPLMAERFRMNEWWRHHSYQELAQVLLSSKIGVNIPRDDYPQIAGLRCFEVMAAGSLLITRAPSELSSLGFREGEHFVGYCQDAEIEDLVRYYLDDERERTRIADAARELVLREHTYDRRVERLLELASLDDRPGGAPARGWSEPRQRLACLRFYASRHQFDHACRELGLIRRADPRTAAVALYVLAKSFAEYARMTRSLPAWRPS